MSDKFEVVGAAFLTSTKKSIKFTLNPPDSYFDPKPFYLTVKDAEALLRGDRETVSLWRPKK